VASVQITLSESFGIGKRGSFYETAGCLRDVIQNHLFQVVALLAMERPPDAILARCIMNKPRCLKPCARLLQTMWFAASTLATDEPDVAKNSDVEPSALCGCSSTHGVGRVCPFISAREVPAQHRNRSDCGVETGAARLFADSAAVDGVANYFRFRLSPNSALALAARVKRAGEDFIGDQRELYLSEQQAGEETPYERFWAMRCRDGALFTRQDAIEAAWTVVIRSQKSPPRSYLQAPYLGAKEATR